jgi:hypothetical protein
MKSKSFESVEPLMDLLEKQQETMIQDADAMMIHASKIQKHASLLEDQQETINKIVSTWYRAGNSSMWVAWRNWNV